MNKILQFALKAIITSIIKAAIKKGSFTPTVMKILTIVSEVEESLSPLVIPSISKDQNK